MLKDKIEEVLSEVSNALPKDMQNFKREIESNLRATLNASFSKMDLVTREEFDIQTALLQRTRTQLDGLQKKLAELEEQATETESAE
ncbi:MAG: accessory factor UbiK family protein [Gammaproteobacteria bacterium]|jgi:BMFP domain-containing protein YqiC